MSPLKIILLKCWNLQQYNFAHFASQICASPSSCFCNRNFHLSFSEKLNVYTQWEREHHSTCFLLFCETQTSDTDNLSFTVSTATLLFCHFCLTLKISCQQFWPFLLHNLLWNVKSHTILSLWPKLFISFHNLYTIIQILQLLADY